MLSAGHTARSFSRMHTSFRAATSSAGAALLYSDARCTGKATVCCKSCLQCAKTRIASDSFITAVTYWCRDCIVPHIEGLGITSSECPICKQPGWRSDLKPHNLRQNIASILRDELAASMMTGAMQVFGECSAFTNKEHLGFLNFCMCIGVRTAYEPCRLTMHCNIDHTCPNCVLACSARRQSRRWSGK